MKHRVVGYVIACAAPVAAVLCLLASTSAQQSSWSQGDVAVNALWHNDAPLRAHGSWRSDVSGEGAWDASFTTDLVTLNGTMTFSGVPGLENGQVTGELSGRTIQLGAVNGNGQNVNLTGTIDDDRLIGAYETSWGDHGLWEGSWRADPAAIDTSDWPLPDPAQQPPYEPAFEQPSVRPEPSGLVSWWRYFRGVAARAYAQTIGANVRVSTTMANEPEVGVDLFGNPDRVVVGANDYTMKLGYYASNSGGASWPFVGDIAALPSLSSYDVGADPVVEFDRLGRAYYGGLVRDSGNRCGTDNRVFVARSDNGGQGWFDAVPVAAATAGSGVLHDKPWLAIDRAPSSPYVNNVYVSWSQWVGGGSCSTATIRLARSTDRGITFSTGDPVSDGFGHGSAIAVDQNGTVHVVWVWGNQIWYDRCEPQDPPAVGVDCGADVPIATINRINPPELPGVLYPVNSHPKIAINTHGTGTQTYGYIYVVWAARTAPNPSPNDAHIYLKMSIDGGNTFTSADPFCPNPPNCPCQTGPACRITQAVEDEFFPVVNVDQQNFVNVIYYRRSSQTANTFNAYAMTSGTATQTWSTPLKINNGPNIGPTAPAPDFIGDYIGLESNTHQQIRSVWMDSRDGQQEIYTANISGC